MELEPGNRLKAQALSPVQTPAQTGMMENPAVRDFAALDLSIVVPALDERDNLEQLLPELRNVVERLGITYEILIVDGGSRDGTAEAAARLGARVIVQKSPGYGEALRLGLGRARGNYVVTMDADLSHGADTVAQLWSLRDPLGIGIASRYVQGGSALMSPFRYYLSRALNLVYGRGLSLPVRDLSSGFRIYPAGALRTLPAASADFDVLPEILVRAYIEGWRVREVPFQYASRAKGSSKARLLRLARAYLRTLARLWRLRNSIEAADYDERAFDSVVPLQRAWQRRRHAIVTRRAAGSGLVLDIGCGSSRIVRDLGNAVGMDITFHKLRYMRRYGLRLVNGTIFALPFADATFERVVCSEVIEHIRPGDEPFREIARVHRRGGPLVLGTPDYGRRSWRFIEALYRFFAPGGYADEHITQYTHDRLRRLIVGLGYRHLRTDYVFGSEMILTFQKT